MSLLHVISQRFGLWFGVRRFAIALNRYMGFESVDASQSVGKDDEFFQRIMQATTGRTLVTHDRMWMLYQLAKFAASRWQDGSMVAECGVFKGGSSYLLACVLEGKTTLHCFDSFCGLMETSDKDVNSVGDFCNTNLLEVREFLKQFKHVKLHAGFIPYTFKQQDEVRYGFVHIDVDTYKTTLACLEYFWPRMADGGVMVFDDYALRGQREAVDLFFNRYKSRSSVVALTTGQAFSMKTKGS
jgi:predicted O-methyltransferase YrrM